MHPSRVGMLIRLLVLVAVLAPAANLAMGSAGAVARDGLAATARSVAVQSPALTASAATNCPAQPVKIIKKVKGLPAAVHALPIVSLVATAVPSAAVPAIPHAVPPSSDQRYVWRGRGPPRQPAGSNDQPFCPATRT